MSCKLQIRILLLVLALPGAHFVSRVDGLAIPSGSRERRSTRPTACQDRYAAIPGHTMCLANIQHNPVRDEDHLAIVQKHNKLRSQVSPEASNMLEMKYFPSLAHEAQIWAENCKLTHESPNQRFLPGKFYVGQNIATSQAPLTWDEVIDLWHKERSNFHYGGPNNLQDVGHYTQVVWARSQLIGCGSAKCGSTYFYVCNYGPNGNDGQIDRPYITGSSCSACKSCSKQLCDCSGKFCENGGTLDVSTCECQCIKAVKTYLKDRCELECHENGDSPLCGTHPFDKGSCSSNKLAPFNCPWLCNVCPYAGTNYTEGSVPLPATASGAQRQRHILLVLALVMIKELV